MGNNSAEPKKLNKELVKYVHDNCTGFDGSLPQSPEYDKMLGGLIYQPHEPNLNRYRTMAHDFAHEYNDMRQRDYANIDEFKNAKASRIGRLFGKVGTNCHVESPVYVDFGCHVVVGDNFYSNYNLVVLDLTLVKIGNNVMIGPNVFITSGSHPVDAKARVNATEEFAYPVTIGDNVWVGAGCSILRGVSIGECSVVAAGAVVSKDVPPHCVVGGIPAKVIRRLEGKPRL